MSLADTGKGGLGIICCFILTLPITGGIWFAIEQHKLNNYDKTNCLTINSSVISSVTSKQNNILLELGKEYQGYWNVVYALLNSTNIFSTIKDPSSRVTYSNALDDLNKHPNNSTSTCFYDKRNVKTVQWDAPNPVPGIVVMSIGLFIWFIIIIFGWYFYVRAE